MRSPLLGSISAEVKQQNAAQSVRKQDDLYWQEKEGIWRKRTLDIG
jgi:hypothetical protein